MTSEAPNNGKQYILAFGDSLTEGYHRHGTRWHPYSLRLQRLLDEAGLNVEVHERGYSGERVTAIGGSDRGAGMAVRLPLLLHESKARGIHYSWVVIMGGINDLGWDSEAPPVYEGLKLMYGAVQRYGARVLALTCLQTAESVVGQQDRRTELNALIRSTQGAEGFEAVTVLDLETALPFPHDPNDVEGRSLWDDGLHLKPAGYDKLGGIVFEALRGELAAPA